MDALQSMKVFTQVAAAGAFAKAGRQLRLSPGAVTKHVASLEDRLGVRLFDRTTRRVSLTEAGRVYLERAQECLQSFDDATAAVSELAHGPSGVLRVAAPVDFAEAVGRFCGGFMTRYPKVVVDLRLSNRGIDLVHEGVDVALRVANALDGQFVARPVAKLGVFLFASPEYLERHGTPRRPAELASHRYVTFSEPKVNEELELERDGKRVRVKPKLSMWTNSGDALREALIAGAGVGVLPSFLAWRALRDGRLERVLPEWSYREGIRLFAIYPHRRFVSANVRTFVDELRAELGDGQLDPWLEDYFG